MIQIPESGLEAAAFCASEAAPNQIDTAPRRDQMAGLEAQLQEKSDQNNALREQIRLLGEREALSNKYLSTIESHLTATRRHLLAAEEKGRAHQDELDKAAGVASNLAAELTDTRTKLGAAQARLRQVEVNFEEVSNLLARLESGASKADGRHNQQIADQRSQHEALQAGAASTERLLGEARAQLLAREEELRALDRRCCELAGEREALRAVVSDMKKERAGREAEFEKNDQAREYLLSRAAELREFERRYTEVVGERDALRAALSEMEIERALRELAFKEAERARADVLARDVALTGAYNASNAARERAEDQNKALKIQIDALTAEMEKQQKKSERKSQDRALNREKLEYSVEEHARELWPLMRNLKSAAPAEPALNPKRLNIKLAPSAGGRWTAAA